MSAKSDVLVLGIGAIALVAGAWYVKKKASEFGDGITGTINDIGYGLNPFNADNYVHQGLDEWYQYWTADTGTYGTSGDPSMGYQTAPVNVPGTATYNNTQPATNQAGYKMGLGDTAIATIANFKWFWEK